MSRRTLALISVLIVITAFLLVLALTPQKPTAPYTTMARPTPILAQTSLMLIPSALAVSTSTPSATVDVVIDSGNNKVTAVQLELSYDPKVISQVDIATPSAGTSFFDNPVTLLKTIDTVKGTISYAIGIQPTGTAKKGKGTVAIISFRPIGSAPQTTSIIFLPKTLVTAEGISISVLKESLGTTISLISSFSPPTQPATNSAQ